MRQYGWAPSTRLFEAAACIISDRWPGLQAVFEPDQQVLLADCREDVSRQLELFSPERRAAIGAAARRRVLADHTYERRAAQVEHILGRVGSWASAS